VLARCLQCGGIHPWKEAVSEYPATLNDQETHIEFILGSGTHLLVAECKRIREGRWGFARAESPSLHRRPRADYLVPDQGQGTFRVVKRFGPPDHAPYDVFVEIPVGQGKSDKTIEKALKQVMLARGALMQDLADAHANPLRYAGGAVVPVIFTTAELVTTETALRTADVHTGDLKTLEGTTTRSWIWFNWNLPRSLRPKIPYRQPDAASHTKTTLLRSNLIRDMTRSVAIVNVSGIELFLNNLRLSLDVDADPMEMW
jgi:hypothetical protein